MDQSQASFLDRLSCVLASNRNKHYPLWFEICSPQLESEVNPASMLWRRQKTRLSLWIKSIEKLKILENNSLLREAKIYLQPPIVLLDPAEDFQSLLLLLQWIFPHSSRECSMENTLWNALVLRTGKVSIDVPHFFAIFEKATIKKDNMFEQKIEVGRNFSTLMLHCWCPQ